MKRRRKQTAVKGRLSAMMISAAVHIAVLIAAGMFVAVTVVQRQEARFEGRQVSRPKMQLQRLQVPQRARQEHQAPQMSQRVTAQVVSTRSIDFKMPEIAGLGGGIRVDMSGAGFSGSLGFSTPQLNLFGLRSQGEKILIMLECGHAMLGDETGGIPGYQVIKEELAGLLSRLPATALFNVLIFEGNRHMAFSNALLPASGENISRLRAWIEPLNEHASEFGLSTLAHEGVEFEFERMAPIPNTQGGWITGISYAIQNEIDSIYWLGSRDAMLSIHKDLYAEAKRGNPIEPISGRPDGWEGPDLTTYPGGEARWKEVVSRARQMHEEENARRRAQGLPDRVLRAGGDNMLVRTYLPGTPIPQSKRQAFEYNYTAQDVVDYVRAMQRKYITPASRARSPGLRSPALSLNVVHFVPQLADPLVSRRLRDAASRLNGSYIQIRGLEEIRSASSTPTP